MLSEEEQLSTMARDEHRLAFLLALLAYSPGDSFVHRSYIEEKLSFAFMPISVFTLVCALDRNNQRKFWELLEHGTC